LTQVNFITQEKMLWHIYLYENIMSTNKRYSALFGKGKAWVAGWGKVALIKSLIEAREKYVLGARYKIDQKFDQICTLIVLISIENIIYSRNAALKNKVKIWCDPMIFCWTISAKKKVCSAIKQSPIFRSRLMSDCWIRVRKTDLRKDRAKNEHFMHVKNYFCALNPFDIYGHILGDNLDLFRDFGVLYRGISSAGRFLWSYSLQYSNKFNIPWTSLQDYGLFIVLFGSFCVPSINLYNTQSILTNSTSNSKALLWHS